MTRYYLRSTAASPVPTNSGPISLTTLGASSAQNFNGTPKGSLKATFTGSSTATISETNFETASFIFVTDAGVPNLAQWPTIPSAGWTAVIKWTSISGGGATATVAARLLRLDSANDIKQMGASVSGIENTSNLDTTFVPGTMHFVLAGSDIAWTAGSSSDRLALMLVVQDSSSSGGPPTVTNFEIDAGNSYLEFVDPVAAFSGTPLSGVAPSNVAFTDASTGGVTTWAWDFGDGGTATTQNPSHNYTVPGLYTVTLVVTNGFGSDSEVKTDYVLVTDPPPVADFSGTPLTGPAPLPVTFTDLTTGNVTSWAWNFNNLPTSTAQNPVHTFTLAGSYTVALTSTGPGGSDTETKVNYVVVAEPAPVADFIGVPLSGVVPLTVVFTDLSTLTITAWAWTFGDGNTSTDQNPTHVYAAEGVYTVTLTVTSAGGTDSETKLAYITVGAFVTNIWNMALARIGVSTTLAGTPDLSGLEGLSCDLFYEHCRDCVLADFPWPFATGYATLLLASDGTDESWEDEWDATFFLPEDFILLRRFLTGLRDKDPAPPEFFMGTFGGVITVFTDVPEELDVETPFDPIGPRIEYTRRITDTSLFPDKFIDALVWRLAADIAMPLSVSSEIRAECWRMYYMSLPSAERTAGNEEQGSGGPDGTFLTSRL